MKRLVIFVLIVGGLAYVMRDDIRPYFDKSSTESGVVADKPAEDSSYHEPSKKQQIISDTMGRMDAYNNAGK
jgi:hypothetical protein